MEAKEKDRDAAIVIPANVMYGSFRDENDNDYRINVQPIDSVGSLSDRDPSDDETRDEEGSDDNDNIATDMEKLGRTASIVMRPGFISVG